MSRLFTTAAAVFAVIAVIVVCARPATAQTIIGVKFGPVFSKLSRGIPESERAGLIGYGGGTFASFKSSAPIGIQIGLFSSQKGAKVDDPASDTDGKLKLGYIELPVSVRIGTKRGGPYVYGGPQVAIESKCETENTNGTVRVSNNCNNQGSTVFRRRKIEFSAVAGAGYRYVLGATGRRNILLEVSRTWGLTNINKDSDVAFVKNRSFSVYLGLATPPAKLKD